MVWAGSEAAWNRIMTRKAAARRRYGREVIVVGYLGARGKIGCECVTRIALKYLAEQPL
jgi:hypothetical protein